MDELKAWVHDEIMPDLKGLIAEQKEMAISMAALCVQMKIIVGNGQPGRLDKLEDKQEQIDAKLQDAREMQKWIVGIGSAIAFAIETHLLFFLHK